MLKKTASAVVLTLVFTLLGFSASAAEPSYKVSGSSTSEVATGRLMIEPLLTSTDSLLTPGDTALYELKFKNTGNLPALLRAKLRFVRRTDSMPLPDGVVNMYYDTSAWKENSDKYHYYTKYLNPGEVTEPLTEKFTFNLSSDDAYQSQEILIKPEFEAVQCSEEAVRALWNPGGYESLGIVPPTASVTENASVDYTSGASLSISPDLFGGFSNMIPGEVISQTVDFSNNSGKDMKFFLRASFAEQPVEKAMELLKNAEFVITAPDGAELFRGSFLGFLENTPDKGGNTFALGVVKSGSTDSYGFEMILDEKLGNEWMDLYSLVKWSFGSNDISENPGSSSGVSGGGTGGGSGEDTGDSGKPGGNPGGSSGGSSYIPPVYEFHKLYMIGHDDGSFGADSGMTRAEAAAMLSRLCRDTYNGSHTSSFRDLDTDMWHYEYIAYMESKAYVIGDPDGRFRPDDNITRAEFITIIARFNSINGIFSGNFDDVLAGNWAENSIYAASDEGWVIGYPDGGFRPDSDISRAEVVTIVNRMLNRKCDSDFAELNSDSLVKFNDLLPDYWAYYQIVEATNSHEILRRISDEVWIQLVK